MSGDDAAGRSDEEVLAAVANRRKSVPVPPIGAGTGNRFREPPGTVGTAPLTFEPLAAFLERTRNLPPVRWLLEDVVPEAGRLLVVVLTLTLVEGARPEIEPAA